MKLAQDYLKETASGPAMSGFNSRILGRPRSEVFRYRRGGEHYRQFTAGWETASGLISKGMIEAVLFPVPENVEPTWQVAVCKPDGNMWFCHGEGFEDLQISGNYAFGETRELAMSAYADLMRPKGPSE